MKNQIKGALLLVTCLIFQTGSELEAQDIYFPGTVEVGDLATVMAIDLTGVVASFFVKKPEPDLLIKKREIKRRSFNFSRLQEYSVPIWINTGAFKKQHYGIVKSINTTHIVLETRLDSVVIALNQIKRIVDLKGGAAWSRKSRIKTGIIYSGLAIGSLYASITNNYIFELDTSTKRWLIFALYGGIATYSFILKNPIEKEYDIWEYDYDFYALQNKKAYSTEVKIGILPIYSGVNSLIIGGKLTMNF